MSSNIDNFIGLDDGILNPMYVIKSQNLVTNFRQLRQNNYRPQNQNGYRSLNNSNNF